MDVALPFRIIVFYASISLASYTSAATDILIPNQNLTDGQTLVSSNNRFELGFFRPDNSINKYLGIWYFGLPLTVVWVANRNDPIINSPARLTMKSDGTLHLYNSSNNILWSTNNTFSGNNPVLQLLGSGNLVVRGGEADGNDHAWQSFDYISDTLLPGMKLGWNLKSSTNRYMRSWKSDNDPSDGDYSFSLDPPESPQLILRRTSEKLYRWGPFDGDRFSGSNRLRGNSVFKPIFISSSDEVYYTFEVQDELVLSRFVVTQLGQVQYWTWTNHSREWSLMIVLNREYCDRYAMCGPYGSCYSEDPNCRCLEGFTPSSPEDWRMFNTLDGCRRIHALNCTNRDGFVRYSGLKLPDNTVVWENYSPAECAEECLKNCDCMAYTRINAHGNGSQCVVWLGKLVDLRNFPDGGEELYIRMARAELDSIDDAKRKKSIPIIVIIVISVVFGILLLATICWYAYKVKKERQEKANEQTSIQYGYFKEEKQDDVTLFDQATIFAATDKFSLANKIGEGGFGPVYKGHLHNGLEIAVKRLSHDSTQGLKEFQNEVKLIAELQHRNLVRLLGYCAEGNEKMLVYEYLPNKSLDNYLFDRTKGRLLHWNKRFDIILGIARGLLYLHQDSRLRIIHRDLKTSNILLDQDLNPKISDFGIARIFGGEQTEDKTKRVVGTYGYMSPEYALSGHFSVKSDVFAFGVIVLEIINGRKNYGFHHPDHDYNLIGHAWKLWTEENAIELVDQRLDESLPANEVIRCVQVALLCLQQRPEDRPTMFSVVFMLSNESTKLPEPKEPGFCTESIPIRIDSSWSNPSCSTAPELTITNIVGR